MSESTNIIDVKSIKSQESYVLPSHGLLYTKEDNIPETVTLRRMTTREEKMRLRNESEEEVRRDILQACILEKFDVNNLKLEDANFLLFKLRVLSLLDDTYKVSLRCTNCATDFVHEINLDEVPVKFLNKDNLKEKFELILPISQVKVTMKLPNLGDTIQTGKIVTKYLEQFPNADRGETIYTLALMLYIDKINDEKLMSEVLEDYIDNLDILDVRALRERTSELDSLYGFSNTEVSAICPSCGQEIKHGIPITGELFNPSK